MTMKKLRAKARVEAFTLIEVLVVVAIIAILWAMVMPTTDKIPTSAYGIACMNNQKQIAMVILIWANDHNGMLPWQVSTNDDGTMEFVPNGMAASQFQSLTNFLTDPLIFICPTDKARRRAADIKSLSNSNISYFVNVDAKMTNGVTPILTGDRHLQAGSDAVKAGLFVYTNGMAMGWTSELHGNADNLPSGVVAFVDGHAEVTKVTSTKVPGVFNRQGLASARLLVP